MNFGIIAAGEGSRLVQEGVGLPKPLVRVDGKPMIGRLVDIFCHNGADEIDIIVNEQMEEVASYLEQLKKETLVPINVIVKSTPSSMHSFYELSRMVRGKGRFIVTTVDTIFRPENFSPYVKAFKEAPEEVAGMMAVTRYVDDEKPLYVATDAEMTITAFCDKHRPDTQFVSGGIYGLSQDALRVLADCVEDGMQRMRNYQRALLSAGLLIKAFDMNKIVDVDHASDIAAANAFLQEGSSSTNSTSQQ